MIIRDERILLQTILRLRVFYESFTVKMLRIESGLIHVSTQTVTQHVNETATNTYLHFRKKELLKQKDKLKGKKELPKTLLIELRGRGIAYNCTKNEVFH